MNCRQLPGVFFLVLLCGCAGKALPPVTFIPPAERVDYLGEVKPILVKRCVVCHSCYKSPCQLKLSSFEGLARGASKKAVYNATRLHSMEPTRLFMDARSVSEWRQKGFHGVTDNSAGCNQKNSLMMQMIPLDWTF
jgi:hypothetical protein